MATQYPSGYPTSDYRNASNRSSTSHNSRSESTYRNGTHSSAQYTHGNRPAQRPPQKRKSNRRKKKVQRRFFLAIVLLVILIVAGVILLPKLFGDGSAVKPNPSPSPSANPTVGSQSEVLSTWLQNANTSSGDNTENPVEDSQNSVTSAWLPNANTPSDDNDEDLVEISAEDQIEVTDLSITPGLPEEWMNVLLLGTDARNLIDPSRTDSIIICSINKQTGEVKLTSIMRDLAVVLDDIGEYTRTAPYRINAANYFGGPELAMKTVNELFDMNIERYISVNFHGFQKIAEWLGGIDMDITEAEMIEINKNIVEQYVLGVKMDLDESDLENAFLMTYGPKTHLDGRQTLGYARIRHIDSDFERSNRQRKVLVALMEKAGKLTLPEIVLLAGRSMEFFSTNLSLEEIVTVAQIVLSSGLSNVETFSLPTNGSYIMETRNGDSMLYDCDFATNASNLYSFIYN